MCGDGAEERTCRYCQHFFWPSKTPKLFWNVILYIYLENHSHHSLHCSAKAFHQNHGDLELLGTGSNGITERVNTILLFKRVKVKSLQSYKNVMTISRLQERSRGRTSKKIHYKKYPTIRKAEHIKMENINIYTLFWRIK